MKCWRNYEELVAFSVGHEYGWARVNEVSRNVTSGGDTVGKIQTDPFRFLICAHKFQTGFD